MQDADHVAETAAEPFACLRRQRNFRNEDDGLLAALQTARNRLQIDFRLAGRRHAVQQNDGTVLRILRGIDDIKSLLLIFCQFLRLVRLDDIVQKRIALHDAQFLAEPSLFAHLRDKLRTAKIQIYQFRQRTGAFPPQILDQFLPLVRQFVEFIVLIRGFQRQ